MYPAAGDIIQFLKSAPATVVLGGIINGNCSWYSPGVIFILTGPPALESAACNARVNVLNGP